MDSSMGPVKQKKNIAKSAMLMTVVSVISLAFSFLQESFFAYFYGANLTTDAYTIAIQVPVTLFSLISTAISTVVIPCYSKELYNKNRESASRYASNLMTAISLFTIVLIVLGEFFATLVISLFAPGMDASTKLLAVSLFRIVLPTILLTELMNINTGIMNVHKSFVLPSLTSNILNITFVTVIALFASKWGIYAAIVGNIVGTCFEFGYSVALRRRFVKYLPTLNFHDASMIQSFKMSLPVFVGIGAAEINKVVDRIVASFFKAGSISMLNYASKLSSAISSLLIHSITTVIYPEFAKCSANKDEEGMADIFSFSLSLFLVIIIPIIAGGTCLSNEIIKIVFGRGAFTMDAVNKTAPLFACYLLCLLFTTFRQTSSRMFYSYGDSRTPMKNSIIGIGINIILNIILGKLIGALGLAIATTISTAVISLLLLRELRNRNKRISYNETIILTVKTVVSAFLMAVLILYMKYCAYELGWYNLSSFWPTVIFVLISITVGSSFYFVVLLLLKTAEVHAVIDAIIRRKK